MRKSSAAAFTFINLSLHLGKCLARGGVKYAMMMVQKMGK